MGKQHWLSGRVDFEESIRESVFCIDRIGKVYRGKNIAIENYKIDFTKDNKLILSLIKQKKEGKEWIYPDFTLNHYQILQEEKPDNFTIKVPRLEYEKIYGKK